MPSYQPKFKKGDEIIIDGRYTVILDAKDKEYLLNRKSRVRWVSASDIDAIATYRGNHYDGRE